jgi:glycosyltransferase involved in cell wall biosynthesis
VTTAVFGLPVYNGEQHLAEALESLLTQTRDDLAVVVVDNASTDGTGEIAARYAELDPRVVYTRNERTIGAVHNWRRAFDLAGERFPAATFFAWASDHDVWHPRWLELLAEELTAHPAAALAYPFAVRIDDWGSEYPTGGHPFETAGLSRAEQRLRHVSRHAAALGDLIYGLARRDALTRAGPYPLVVLPDRLLLLRLSLEGEFRQVPRRLWFRRYRTGVVMSNRRQRQSFFVGRAPWWAHVPWPVTHAVAVGRAGGGRLPAILFLESVRRALVARWDRSRRRFRWRRRRWRRLYRALGRGALERLGLWAALLPASTPANAGPPTAVDALTALERAEVLDELRRPGATLLELGGGAEQLAEALRSRFPGAVYAAADGADTFPEAVDLAVSVGGLGGLSQPEVERRVHRLHELGTRFLYCLEPESATLREALSRWYWLRDVWVDSQAPSGPKPDPLTGRIPRDPGRYRHLVGHRRLLPHGGAAQGRA